MTQSIIIILIVSAFFLTVLGLSHIVSRGADNSTFFTGNRRMPWMLVCLAMICAPISGVTFISVPGMVAAKGYGYLQMCAGFVVGYLVIAFVLLPVYYRNNVVSIYDYLGKRFGASAHKTGAWMFLISKITGTAVRFFVICAVLQLLVFEPIRIPFPVTVLITLSLVWIYTARGGVKSVIWVDMFKCLCIVASVTVCVVCLIDTLNFGDDSAFQVIASHPSAHIFNFDDPTSESYFWKQFVAGIFLVVAMTGLDQDMMQHALTCRNARNSMKNMVVSSLMQCLVISLLLVLGTLLVMYADTHSLSMPEKSDNLFAMIAFDDGLPAIVGVFFILGLVAATYSSVGSALTSLTTSYTVDILQAHKTTDSSTLKQRRTTIHLVMAAAMALIIIGFYYCSSEDAISAVFTLASYTYGPILGLFAFGLFTNRSVPGRLLPLVCLLSPLVCLLLQWVGATYFGYKIGFELLLINASLTIIGLTALSYLPARRLSKVKV